jgi:DNA-binding response OmpR family regulator
MPLKAKYIIIVCDDDELCKQLDNSLREQPAAVKTAIVNTVDQLMELVTTKAPDTILLYLVQAQSTPAQWIRCIRKETLMDSIPILVYSGAPDEKELRESLI